MTAVSAPIGLYPELVEHGGVAEALQHELRAIGSEARAIRGPVHPQWAFARVEFTPRWVQVLASLEAGAP